MLSAAKHRISSLAQTAWDNAWVACKEGADLKRYVDLPTKDNLELHMLKGTIYTMISKSYYQSLFAFQHHKGLKKSVSSVITRLRTKIALRDPLFKYKAKDSPDCPCIAVSCRLHEGDRWATRAGEGLDVPKILTTKALAVKAAKIMIRTGLLNVFSGAKVD